MDSIEGFGFDSQTMITLSVFSVFNFLGCSVLDFHLAIQTMSERAVNTWQISKDWKEYSRLRIPDFKRLLCCVNSIAN